MKRLNESARNNPAVGSSTHWTALKEAVKRTANIEPFEQLDDVHHPSFRYLNSLIDTDRFEILARDEPYVVTPEWQSETARALPPGAGPIEINVARFMLDPNPLLGILVGGMGSGKTTTLRQMEDWLCGSIETHHLNCNEIEFDRDDPPQANELLARFLNSLMIKLINPDAEYGDCWNWALEQFCETDRGERHSAISVLEPAADRLRTRYGRNWLRSDAEAIDFRRQEVSPYLKERTEDRLGYIAVKLDYYLSVICKGQRSRVCIVLDNIDPLPPMLQRDLLLATGRLQLNARCKVVLAMRPLTYNLTQEQRSTRIVKMIQHIGPPPLKLIKDRLERLVHQIDMPALRLPTRLDSGAERVLSQDDFKAWVRQVVTDIEYARTAAGARTRSPSALEFFEGLSNLSLRTALMLAEKVFGSRRLSMALPDTTADPAHPTASAAVPTTRLKSHHIIRAVLLHPSNSFVGSIFRVTDNLFDLGDFDGTVSLTCKYRLLKELAEAPGHGTLELAELVKRMKAFGYDEAVILRGVNGLIDEVKRMAWSDKVVTYGSLDEPSGSRLTITHAGRFYVTQAVFSLEYIQEVHVDVLMPDLQLARHYNHDDLGERLASLYRFVRHLHDVDRKEVKTLLASGACQRYRSTYGAELFSITVAEALEDQVANVGRKTLHNWATRRRPTDIRTHELEQTLLRWESLGASLRREDAAVLAGLNADA